jgi:DNA-binding SARP family transcriptional activator
MTRGDNDSITDQRMGSAMSDTVTLYVSSSTTNLLRRNNAPLANLPTNRCYLLLLHVAQHKGQSLCRDAVAEGLWPEAAVDIARRRLRSELWRLKNWFDLHCFNIAPFLRCERNALVVSDQLPVSLDSDELHQMACSIEQGKLQHRTASVDTIFQLVERFGQGVLLNHFNCWAEHEKGRVQHSLRECREYLFQHYCQQGDWREAIVHGQALVRAEPLDEYLHGELMRCFIACDCRGLAIRQYANCQKILREELGISPSLSLQKMYRELLDQDAHAGYTLSRSSESLSA